MLIVLFEIYNNLMNNVNVNVNMELNKKEDCCSLDSKKIKSNKDKFNVYFLKEGKKTDHYPGKVVINDDNNVVLHFGIHQILMEKDKIYTLEEDFTIESINLNDGYIKYKYSDV